MADCSNVEIRELLPERAGSALSAADLARVDAHLASCPTCTAELALIHAARRAVPATPAIDIGRISARVVAATLAPSRPQLVTSERSVVRAGRAPRMRWIGLKAAAAVAIAAAGIGSFAVYHSTDDGGALPDGATVAVASPTVESTTVPTAPTVSTGPVTVASAASPDGANAEIGVAGGLSDLSANELQALLGDLGNTSSVADDAAFEEPTQVLPDVGDLGGGESL
jgi:anti-sigma factor RsiW